jgi:acetylornithine/N-succinyldiaminopimelate aminotransferase
MKIEEIKSKNEKYIMNTYGRLDICLERGQGTKVWDTENNEYLDFLAGIAVTNLGHSNPKVVKALKDQVEKMFHSSNLYHIENQVKLAELIVENSSMNKVFFCNSGAEANEGAIKLARKYGKMKLNGRSEIITMKKSFHGRTITTVTATGQEKYQKDFTPLTEGFKYAEYGNIDDLKSKINENTLAVMIEVIQGEGGVNVLTQNYWDEISKLVSKNNILLIIDEVQTGVGRTGHLFAYERYGLKPHIATLAKGLGNGVPIGAVTSTDEVAVFVPGDHASTFGGNHLSTAAGVAVLEEVSKKDFLESVIEKGNYFKDKLSALQKEYKIIKDVRGEGLLIGVELEDVSKISEITQKMLSKGVLMGSAGGIALRFAPPLTVSKDEIAIVVDKLNEVFAEL